MTLSIRAFPSGIADTNAYVVLDPESNHALIIDAPRDVTDTLANELAGKTVDRIVITHTHWDHIGDAAALKARFGAPIAAHPLAVPNLETPGSTLTRLPYEIEPARPDELLNEGDAVALGDHRFTVMHLPGHEPSHIVLYSESDRVFLGGDVLFPNGHGRTDLPGSDQAIMNQTLRRVVKLPDDVTVYPGHGVPTTIGRERGWIEHLE
jgi:hydroxyacylglutathione hydrolase